MAESWHYKTGAHLALCSFLAVFVLTIYITPAKCMPPAYLPCLNNNELTLDELTLGYFENGFTHLEIVAALFYLHNIVISVRHLKRRLRRLGLKRRPVGDNISSLEEVVPAILSEMQNSGSCLGYRAIWRRLIVDHGLRIRRDMVLQIMRIIDPDGVARRKARRLQRRRYVCPGPSFVWHVDGYDKLKPFGFAIHGCIDGFSRRILWLRVASSNNNPAIVATYYLDVLKQLNVVPKLMRCDFGTENTTLRLLQLFFNYNDANPDDCLSSFVYDKSTSNQRIEAWWALLRKQGVHWWINLFKDMRDSNHFEDANPLHRECLKFCFMAVLQAELDDVARHWNLHLISKSRNAELPHGKPDILYFTPELYHTRSYGIRVDQADVQACTELYGTNIHHLPCCPEFIELVHCIKPDLRMPSSPEDALALYLELTNNFRDYD